MLISYQMERIFFVGAFEGSYAKVFERNGSNSEVTDDEIFGELGRLLLA